MSLAVLYVASGYFFWGNTLHNAPWLDYMLTMLPAFALTGMASYLFKRKRKALQRARDARARRILKMIKDSHDATFCLYLRPHWITNKLRVGTENPLTEEQAIFASSFGGPSADMDFEGILMESLERCCDFLGLGWPGETIGVGRVLTEEAQWKPRIKELMQRAEVILFVPSHSKGTLWELNHIRTQKYLDKTIFILPPEMPKWEWKTVCERLAEDDFGWNLVQSEAASKAKSVWLRWLEPSLRPCFFTLDESGSVTCAVAIFEPDKATSLRHDLLQVFIRTGRNEPGCTFPNEPGCTFPNIVVCPDCGIRVNLSDGFYPCCRREREEECTEKIDFLAK